MAGNRRVSDQRRTPRRPPQMSLEEITEKVDVIRATGDATLMKILEDAVEAAYRLLQYSQKMERVNPDQGQKPR